MENILDNTHLRCEGDWMLIWKLQAPPKIKHFLWRLLRGCLLTRSNLRKKQILCPLIGLCLLQNKIIENEWHLFLACDHAQHIWLEAILGNLIEQKWDNVENFHSLIFHLLQDFLSQNSQNWCGSLGHLKDPQHKN